MSAYEDHWLTAGLLLKRVKEEEAKRDTGYFTNVLHRRAEQELWDAQKRVEAVEKELAEAMVEVERAASVYRTMTRIYNNPLCKACNQPYREHVDLAGKCVFDAGSFVDK